MPTRQQAMLASLAVLAITTMIWAQSHGQRDTGEPGDRMIQALLAAEAARIDAGFLQGVKSAEDLEKLRPMLREQYFHMLGLWPLPERTELHPVTTGTLTADGFTVDMVHFQSMPGLYVTGNLYRPTTISNDRRLPAVLYLCGHCNQGRNGNKICYQSHGIWFARHGYVCLTLDTVQLGEIAGVHHGTYREKRWWWHSRGYTPAGVECWNGMRAIDYLTGRDDVDPQRIAVTGISGGGASTWWIAAADERVKVAVPVSGMADLLSYIPNRTINGHCDCMFMYNTYQWPWTTIAALIAPRPLLFVNSDDDAIFPMDANERISNRLERLYSLFGHGDRVDALVSIGGHDYRKDIRMAAFRFINTHLKGDASEVTDSEVDLADRRRRPSPFFPIPGEKLRVFPTDRDIPGDALNGRIDEVFVPMAKVQLPAAGQFEQWKSDLLTELRRISFGSLPKEIAPAVMVASHGPIMSMRSTPAGESEDEQLPEFQLMYASQGVGPIERQLLVVLDPDAPEDIKPPWLMQVVKPSDQVVLCQLRGTGSTNWTRKNPPNYVERSLALLGQTVDTLRVRDIAAAAAFLNAQGGDNPLPIEVVGEGTAGILAAYAAVFHPAISAVTLIRPPASHMAPGAPQFLSILRTCDIPECLALLAPRPITLIEADSQLQQRLRDAYHASGAGEKVHVLP